MFSNRLLLAVFVLSFLQFGYLNSAAINFDADDEKNICIYFDIGNVLVEAEAEDIIWHIGPLLPFRYLYHYGYVPSRRDFQTIFFKYLNLISDSEAHESIKSYGLPLPGILSEWMIGDVATEEITTRLERFSDYKSDLERDIVLASASVMREENYISFLRPISSMVRLFRECVEKYPGQIYILSNWGGDMSRKVINKFTDIFEGVDHDHLIFSNEVKLEKPNPEIYNLAMQRARLDSGNSNDCKKCFIIDDSIENIRGAKAYGWNGTLYKDDLSQEVRLHLINNGLKALNRYDEDPLLPMTELCGL